MSYYGTAKRKSNTCRYWKTFMTCLQRSCQLALRVCEFTNKPIAGIGKTNNSYYLEYVIAK